MPALRLILGDQLNTAISSLSGCNKKRDLVLICELLDEASYVRHHKKKIVFLFSAMRHFARELISAGYKVQYVHLDESNNSGSFRGELRRTLKSYPDLEKIIVTEPGEYRLMEEIKSWKKLFKCDVEIRQDDRFLCSIDEFSEWTQGRKSLRMEYFYRDMRKKYNILMDGSEPQGGKWNYDVENRKPARKDLQIPAPYTASTDTITDNVIKLVDAQFSDHFGDIHPFHYAVTRKQALYALHKFVRERLDNFGDYQDAMIEDEPWMYHSHLSFYLNCGLLLPMECVEQAVHAYDQGKAPLNAVEGFIRQIIGWREYVRGIYWMNMPNYAHENYLNATRHLPPLYWSAETEMNCLGQCVKETRENAYAHHIQRLMVLGNFALLAGISPAEVNEWFLIVYADAYEWVEMPNVTGMILYADGGYLASKPYAAGGSYINKMSDYCKSCHYKVSQKNGADACPFNYLYWDFLDRNRNKLASNPRVGMMYKTLDRMSPEKYESVKADAAEFLNKLDRHEKV